MGRSDCSCFAVFGRFQHRHDRPCEGVWFCGTAYSERAINDTAERFGRFGYGSVGHAVSFTGPRPSGAPVLLLLSTNEGRYEQHLVNTLGPIEFMGAFNFDRGVDLRNRLYDTLGAAYGRYILAQFFPGGSARQEIRRRVVKERNKAKLSPGDKHCDQGAC